MVRYAHIFIYQFYLFLDSLGFIPQGLPLLEQALWLLPQLLEYILWVNHVFDLLGELLFAGLNFFFFELDNRWEAGSWFGFENIHPGINDEPDEALYLGGIHERVGPLLRGVAIHRFWGDPFRKNAWWLNFTTWLGLIITHNLLILRHFSVKYLKAVFVELFKRFLRRVLGGVRYFTL